MRNVNRSVIDHRSRRVSCPRLKWTRSKSAVAPCGASGAGWMRRDERLYSGLTDDDVQKFQGLDILDLAAAQPEHQEITLLFLAGHEKAFREAAGQHRESGEDQTPDHLPPGLCRGLRSALRSDHSRGPHQRLQRARTRWEPHSKGTPRDATSRPPGREPASSPPLRSARTPVAPPGLARRPAAR